MQCSQQAPGPGEQLQSPSSMSWRDAVASQACSLLCCAPAAAACSRRAAPEVAVGVLRPLQHMIWGSAQHVHHAGEQVML